MGTHLAPLGHLHHYHISCSVQGLSGQTAQPNTSIDGGIRIVEPIISGTISGGLAAPVIANPASSSNGTTAQMAYIYAYGHASDGSPFYIEESGIGSGATQTTRLIIDVGGKYEGLRRIYVLGQPVVNKERTLASVDCFGVPLPPTTS
ncbi:hypothetical protein DV736_g5490, partial [Chaetothyriales sp. CBS 134916]